MKLFIHSAVCQNRTIFSPISACRFESAFLGLFLLLIGAVDCSSQGILILKPRAWDKDALAVPLEYKSASKFSSVYNVVTHTGQSRRINSGLILRDIEFSALAMPEKVVSQADAQILEERVASLEDTIRRWPASGSSLAKYLSVSKTALEKYRGGSVYVSGKWLTQAEHSKALADTKAADEAHQAEVERTQHERNILRAKELEHSITQLETTTAQLTQEATSSNLTINGGIETRNFTLLRKLPQSSFEDLYLLGNYVFECMSHGRERCILVSNSIRTLEKRNVTLLVNGSADIDVTTRAGFEERAAVFVEADAQTVKEFAAQRLLKENAAELERQKRELLRLNEVIRQKSSTQASNSAP